MTTHYDTVKYVEHNGKWKWKRYDENGSVVYRSPEFNTEREARADYDENWGSIHTQGFINQGQDKDGTPTTVIAPTPEEIAAVRESDSAGVASAEEAKPVEDNTAGSATSSDEQTGSKPDLVQ